MKLLVLLLLVSACGNSPLFAPLESPNGKTVQTESLKSNDEYIWKDNRNHFAISWDKKPSLGSNSPFKIKFWDSYQTNFLGPYELISNQVCVFLWMKMPSGEHGTSPFEIEIKNSEDGPYYYFNQVYFIMSGNWQLRVRTVQNKSDCKSLKNDNFLEEVIVEITI
jgi:hypothetical protein